MEAVLGKGSGGCKEKVQLAKQTGGRGKVWEGAENHAEWKCMDWLDIRRSRA